MNGTRLTVTIDVEGECNDSAAYDMLENAFSFIDWIHDISVIATEPVDVQPWSDD